jgi:hypothetical protein
MEDMYRVFGEFFEVRVSACRLGNEGHRIPPKNLILSCVRLFSGG